MADSDFSGVAVRVQWVSATWALQKLAAAPGASRGSGLAELKHVYETGEVIFRGGASFRWRTMADFADPYRVPGPEVPLPSDELIIFDRALRQTHKLTVRRGGEVIAIPRLEAAPRVAWVLSCRIDDLRKQWPSIFAPIAEAARSGTREEPPPSFGNITEAIEYVITAQPLLKDTMPYKRDEIIEDRLKELSKKQFGNEDAYRCQSLLSLRRNIQIVIKRLKEQKKHK